VDADRRRSYATVFYASNHAPAEAVAVAFPEQGRQSPSACAFHIRPVVTYPVVNGEVIARPLASARHLLRHDSTALADALLEYLDTFQDDNASAAAASS
jgi:hypothetical protein